MFADIADELQEGELAHPVVVVDQQGGVGFLAVEVEELAQLFFDALLVVAQRGFIQQVAFLAFAGGVADHAGGAAEQGDGPVAAALQVRQHHDAHQVADMQ